jgi:hypothetical protein
LPHGPAGEAFEGFGAKRPAHRGPDPVEVDAEACEQLGVAWGRAVELGLERRPHALDIGGQESPNRRWQEIAVLHEGKEQMFRPHVVVTQGPGFRAPRR